MITVELTPADADLVAPHLPITNSDEDRVLLGAQLFKDGSGELWAEATDASTAQHEASDLRRWLVTYCDFTELQADEALSRAITF